MESSASTLNRTRSGEVPLYLWVAGEDHPKACTGRRLLRRGLARAVGGRAPTGKVPILLDPRADEPLSRADRALARSEGVAAVDCSWNLLHSRGGYPEGPTWFARLPRRRLPLLLAGNPQHYGRLGELNTAEALAASLRVLGDTAGAERLLESFPGAEGFWALNRALFESYAAAADPTEIRAAESSFF